VYIIFICNATQYYLAYNAIQFAESFQTTITEFGHIDIVINNAGIMNDRFWELEVDINLVSKHPIDCDRFSDFSCMFHSNNMFVKINL